VTHRRKVWFAAWASLLGTCVLVASQPTGASSRRPLKLVAIGDSLPYGLRDCNYCLTFVERFGKALSGATGRRVTASNLSEHTGIDSSDLRKELGSSRSLRAAVAGADAITVTIGHNDQPWNREDDPCGARTGATEDWTKYDATCLAATAATYGGNLDAILRQIRALRAGKRTLLRVTNDYDDLIGDPSIPSDTVSSVKVFYDTYGDLTCQLARKYKAVCIDTYHAFNGAEGTRDAGSLLAGDHTHPSARGHALIARLLVQAGFAPLRH